jgi:carbon starvation protein
MQWERNPNRVTQSHTDYDGGLFPDKAPVLLGHHFASIGAPPHHGPLAPFSVGYRSCCGPHGGFFFGAGTIFLAVRTIRHMGKSIAMSLNKSRTQSQETVSSSLSDAASGGRRLRQHRGGPFNGYNAAGELVPANGSTATIAMLLIVISIAFGGRRLPQERSVSVSTLVGSTASSVHRLGSSFPVYLCCTAWFLIVLAYIFIASVTRLDPTAPAII